MRLTLEEMAVAHCGGFATEHNELCPECVLNRRCRALVASYAAKVDDLRRETLRSEALATLLREAVGWLTFTGGQRAKLELAARIDAALGSFSSLTRQPSYVPPPADPLLAKPEKNR